MTPIHFSAQCFRTVPGVAAVARVAGNQARAASGASGERLGCPTTQLGGVWPQLHIVAIDI